MSEQLSDLTDRKTLTRLVEKVVARPAGSPAALRKLHTVLRRAKTHADTVLAVEPIRSIHHVACSGGTLVSKAIEAMPNTVLLSEVDPLSTLHLRGAKRPFFPTDLIPDLRFSVRPAAEETVIAVFSQALLALHRDLRPRGRHLVVRDHAHSQFFTAQDAHARPTVHKIIAGVGPSLAIVTVRHPLDSLLALRKNGWIHHRPDTLEEYCRRYLDFLDAHSALPVVKYEEFVAHPARTMEHICALLSLPFDAHFETHMSLSRLSGDSGRSGQKIAARPRRPVAFELRREMGQSQAYAALCAALEYDP